MTEWHSFGGFRLEPDRSRLLRRDGTEVRIPFRVYRVLEILLQAAPSVVQKDIFFKNVWGKVPETVEDRRRFGNYLDQAIFILRHELRDNRLVVTRSKRGYEIGVHVKRGSGKAGGRILGHQDPGAGGIAHGRAEEHVRDADVTPPPEIAPTPYSDMPRALSFSTKWANPQWADFVDYLCPPMPWTLRCTLSTDSVYFRFGFKLLGLTGRRFGDGSIQSDDANLVVHVGRNYWDRAGISKRDLFLAPYANGQRLDADKKVYKAPTKLRVRLELTVDSDYVVRLFVDRALSFSHVVPAAICGRLVILAHGDQDEFRVNVTQLSLKSFSRA